MRAGRGVQAEVVASLAIIMVTATALLTAFLFRTQAAQVEAVQGLIGQALLAEARSPTYAVGMTTPGVEWWTLDPDGRVVHRGSRVDSPLGKVPDRSTNFFDFPC